MRPNAPPRRPLVGVAILFLAGTAAGLKLGGTGWHVAGLALAATVAAACAWRAPRASAALFAAAIAICGTGFFAGAVSAVRLRDEHAWIGSHARQTVVVRGIIDRASGMRPPGRRTRRPVVPLRQAVIDSDGGSCALTQTPVWVRWYGDEPPPAVGETWGFRTRLPGLDSGSHTPYLPLNSRAGDGVRLAPPRFRDWRPAADRARSSAARRLALGIETWSVVPTLIQAMLLGTRSEIPWQINAVFRDSGTIHVFAISGLGIGLVAAVMAAALSFLGLPRNHWGIPLIPLLTAYTLLTGASPSAMRACLMAAIYFGAPLLGRKPDGPSALATAALLQIAWRPGDLFNLSFVLSYAAMAGIILLFPPCSRLCRKALGESPAARTAALYRLAQRLTTQRARLPRQVWAVRMAVWRHQVRRALADTLAMSLAAWLASVPLTAFYFGRFTPGGLLANLVVVPAAFLITITGALSILSSAVSTFAAEVFNHAAACGTAVMVAASRLTAGLPGATLRVPPPPAVLIAVWYAALLAAAWRLQAREADAEPDPAADDPSLR